MHKYWPHNDLFYMPNLNKSQITDTTESVHLSHWYEIIRNGSKTQLIKENNLSE